MIANLIRTATAVTIAATATMISFTAIASPASAADAARTAIVATKGVDLGSGAGRAQVEARVRQAARQVCAITGAEAWKQRAEVRACETNALASASQQIAAIAAASQVADATPHGPTSAQ